MESLKPRSWQKILWSERHTRLGGSVAVFTLTTSLVLTGCSTPNEPKSSDPGSYQVPSAQPTSYPLTIDNCGEKVTISQPPQRVVILNGASVGEVESLIVLGQEKAVIGNLQGYGVSDQAGMEKKIAALPRLSSLTGGENAAEKSEGAENDKDGNAEKDRGNQNAGEDKVTPPAAGTTAEQILASKPDLVISTWAGGFDPSAGAPTRSQLATQGIASYVNPAQCDTQANTATDAQKTQPGIKNSYDMLMDLGRIFDAQKVAVEHVKKSVEKISRIHEGANNKQWNALIAYPDMAAMNANGLPAVMTGGIYDEILRKAGFNNAIKGDKETTQTLTAEKLAAADVDVLVLGRISPGSDPKAQAERLFAAYPQWKASKEKRWVSVSDSVYYGPLNSIAVEKIAAAR